MKTKSRKLCTVNVGRWISYAAAGAVTAMGASDDAGAAILYSGPLNTAIASSGGSHAFTMKTLIANSNMGAGKIGRILRDYVQYPPGFGNQQAGFFARFRGNNVNSHSVHARGTFQGAGSNPAYLSKLTLGANINAGTFILPNNRVVQMAAFNGTTHGGALGTSHPGTEIGHRKWATNGTGFMGFEFNLGSGEQYGWARLTMSGGYKHDITVVDYAYGTPGQAITAGEEVAPTPEPAALGLLAIGAVGLLAARRGWRRPKVS